MKVVIDVPPIWEEACNAFDFDKEHTVFTYNDTIYNPGAVELTQDVIEHEATHMRQQEGYDYDGMGGGANWWKMYIEDPTFRFRQELHAYRVQYEYFRKHEKNREKVNEFAHSLARLLMGPMYGNLRTSKMEVVRLIKNNARGKRT
jgi:hypothetical protein